MRKGPKTLILGAICIMLAFAGQLAMAEEQTIDGEYHNPSPEEIAAQQPDEWNEETGQFESIQEHALGDVDSDLVYTPITPCRLVDTRPAASPAGSFIGPIAGGTTLDIDTDGGGSLAAQGGNAAGCGSYDNVAAVVVTVTAASASGNGHFQVFPYGDSLPNASVLNYKTTYNTIANTTIVPQNTSGAMPEISLYTSATTHVVVDIVGYYEPPAATAPTQYMVSNGSESIGTGINTVYSPTCPTNYRLVSGGCGIGSWTADVKIVSCRPSDGSLSVITGSNVADRWMGQYNNNSGSSQDIYVQALCIRVP